MGIQIRKAMTKELARLPMDSLEKALAKMTRDELLGLARPIANRPRSLTGKNTRLMYLMICDELMYRNPADWLNIEKDLEERSARAARMDFFVAPFRM